jgi:hypothetical protein
MKVDLSKEDLQEIIYALEFVTRFKISHVKNLRNKLKTVESKWEKIDDHKYQLEYDYMGGPEIEVVDVRDQTKDIENGLLYIGLNSALIKRLESYQENIKEDND